MSDSSQGDGWWLASDGKWYPPEQAPGMPVSPPEPSETGGLPPVAEGPRPLWRRWWVLAIGALLLLGGIGAIVAAGDDDDPDPPDAADAVSTTTTEAGDDEAAPSTTEVTSTTGEPGADATTTTAEASTTTTTAAPTTPTEFEEGCGYAGVDDFGDMQVDLRVVNPLTEVGDISVTYALVDGDDVRFVTSTAFFEAARPQERFRVQDDTVEDLPSRITDDSVITCRILEIEAAGFGEPPLVTEDAACAYVGLDLTISNPFDDTTDLAITYALRGPGGIRFDTSTAFIDVVAPGEVVRVEEDTVTDVPDWVSESDLTCEVIDVEDFGF